ncbi:hypothetical protein IVB40_34965 [Bradyrhizobium sp. 40]|uniref:Swt1 family HEPN domain-containing protein n=1 Tax=Bradyrhizobium TaxID=374 RepID=UPI001FFF4758|nr:MULTISPECIES: Swt1 family HEPN domain-containing protein [Bradyrhizobium]UPJ42404.1 hypothetical protein IVB40_34965 [Bradyrhizobium sp. 40]GLR92691.1 hypothetical protein GCM10007858_03120 [Bradyrhizobium liaoningense]
MSGEALKRFVFNGLLLEQSFKELEAAGIAVHPVTDKKIAERAEKLDFSPRMTAEAAKMASVFALFFCVENSCRELVTERLLERHGIDWWETCVPTKIKTAVQSLKEAEEHHRYHTTRSSESIGYTTFGNLAQVVIARWQDFEDLFPDQAWIVSRFKDMEMSRNIIMHTGILAPIEIDRVESIARDWVRQVG